MFKKSYFVISLWVVLGALSGLIISSFYGKTDIYIPYYHSISNVLERTSPSVVNIWTIKKWKAWQEQSNEFGYKFNRRVVKTGFFPITPSPSTVFSSFRESKIDQCLEFSCTSSLL